MIKLAIFYSSFGIGVLAADAKKLLKKESFPWWVVVIGLILLIPIYAVWWPKFFRDKK